MFCRATAGPTPPTTDDLVEIGPDGASTLGPPLPKQAVVHARLAELTGSAAVIHVTSVSCIVLASRQRPKGGVTATGLEILRGLRGIDSARAEVFVPIVPLADNPTNLATAIVEMLAEWPSADGLLVDGGGLYTWGASIAEAARRTEILEFVFECMARQHPAGAHAP